MKICNYYPWLEDYDPHRKELCEAGGEIARIPCTTEDEERCKYAQAIPED